VQWRRWIPKRSEMTGLRVLQWVTAALVATLCFAGIVLWDRWGPILAIAAVILSIFIVQERRHVRVASTLAELEARLCPQCRQFVFPTDYAEDRCPTCGSARPAEP
jgi:hypothetical protein